MKRILIGFTIAVIAIVFTATPVPARAQTVAELQAQIQALLAQISQLQLLLTTMNGGGETTPQPSSCIFDTNMGLGDVDGVKTQLLRSYLVRMRFLDINLSIDTATFDSNLQAALARYQVEFRISPAVGYLGPVTRAHINARLTSADCGGVLPDSGGLNISSPKSGEVWQKGKSYSIDWNHSIDSPVSIVLIDERAGPNFRVIAKGIQRPSSFGDVSYTWTVPDLAGLEGKSYKIWIGEASLPAWLPVGSTGDWQPYVNLVESSRHSYSQNFSISNTSSEGAPVISGIDGPTSLNVNQTGIWTIKASDPNNGNLSYSVDWQGNTISSAVKTAPTFIQTATFSHSYSTPGTYNVIFRVRNAAGQESQSSVTVLVMGNTNNQFLVTSPVGGESWTRGSTQTIKWTYYPGRQYITAPTFDLYLKNSAGTRYSIAKNVASYGHASYNWVVGSVIEKIIIPATSYKIQVCPAGTVMGCVESPNFFKIYDNTSVPFTVLTPNGGETWMLNSNKTIITWTPEPDSEAVEAYLEKLQDGKFVTIGKMLKAAKGSIVWVGEIDNYGKYPTPGSGYYVRLVNNKSGAVDRSDTPFTIVPADYVKVDLKINGSDSPIIIPAGGSNVKLSWTSVNTNNTFCSFQPGELGSVIYNLPPSGERTVFLKANTFLAQNYSVSMNCDSQFGFRNDYVEVKPLFANQSVISGVNAIAPSPVINGQTQIQVGWFYDNIPLNQNLKYKVGLYSDLNGGIWGNNILVPVSSAPTGDRGEVIIPNISSAFFNKDYYIRVRLVNADGSDYLVGGRRVEARSIQTFQVVAPASVAPSVTVTSPQAGQTFTVGQQMTIRYSLNNFPRAVQVNLQLNENVPPTSFTRSPITSTLVGGTGTYTYTWTIPTHLQTGNGYNVQVIADYGNSETVVVARSNDFTITAPTSANRPPVLTVSPAIGDVAILTLPNATTNWVFTATDLDRNLKSISARWSDQASTYTTYATDPGTLSRTITRSFTSTVEKLALTVTATDQAGLTAQRVIDVYVKSVPTYPSGNIDNSSYILDQNIPTLLAPGQKTLVTIQMKNTGNNTWVKNGPNGQSYFLGAQNPQDNLTWMNTARVSLVEDIPPGGIATFKFEITAPSTPGSYPFQWRMVREYVRWFGAYTPLKMIQVATITTNASSSNLSQLASALEALSGLVGRMR